MKRLPLLLTLLLIAVLVSLYASAQVPASDPCAGTETYDGTVPECPPHVRLPSIAKSLDSGPA
jgi:hypothetical protein